MVGKLKKSSGGMPPPFVKTFTCSGCGAPVRITALGQSLIAVCSACGTAVDASNENLQVLTKNSARPSKPPVIKLGTRGKLHGTLWECIGFMERSDTKFYVWSEYLLYNPQKGFRWLSENSGHWSWIKTTKSPAKNYNWGAASYLNKTYKLFHIGRAKIEYVAGEFYWRAKVGDITKVEDYISPPEILSLERSEEEVIWSLGEYIQSETIKRAFSLDRMPEANGVAPNEPWDAKKSLEGIMSSWWTFVIILVVLQFVAISRSPNQIIDIWEYKHAIDSRQVKTKNFVTDSFVLSGSNRNLEVSLEAPVNNDWFFAEFELVNDDTGASKNFDIGVEYYFGYDGGESWSEGSQSKSKLIRSVPNGTYHLNISSSTSKTSPVRFPFRVKAVRGVTEWSRFFWYLFWISLVPLLILWRKRNFERQRWVDSDFSPYHGQDEY